MLYCTHAWEKHPHSENYRCLKCGSWHHGPDPFWRTPVDSGYHDSVEALHARVLELEEELQKESGMTPCCGEFDRCERRCVPLARHWRDNYWRLLRQYESSVWGRGNYEANCCDGTKCGTKHEGSVEVQRFPKEEGYD